MKPFLNVDLGELADEPDELYALAHAASVACGGHAGDARSMGHAIDMCKLHGTRIGAHPSYPDRAGFGRTPIEIAAESLRASIAEQCASLVAIARARGAEVTFAKPHGALYHAAHREPAVARAVVDAIAEVLGPVEVVGPAAGALAEEAARAGLRLVREGFADRGYRADGSLVPRGEPGALLVDPERVRAQVRELLARGAFETLCVHGDGPNALAVARAARAELDA